MKLSETYNIHKKINCIFPFFKSKHLCKKGIHNYRINIEIRVIPHYYEEEENNMVVRRVENYEYIDLTNLKCYCCGKEERLD